MFTVLSIVLVIVIVGLTWWLWWLLCLSNDGAMRDCAVGGYGGAGGGGGSMNSNRHRGNYFGDFMSTPSRRAGARQIPAGAPNIPADALQIPAGATKSKLVLPKSRQYPLNPFHVFL